MCYSPGSGADVQTILDSLEDGLGTMAMVNYPYPTNFTANIPANPVKAACDAAAAIQPSQPTRDPNAAAKFDFINIERMFAAANVYFSYNNTAGNCWDLTED